MGVGDKTSEREDVCESYNHLVITPYRSRSAGVHSEGIDLISHHGSHKDHRHYLT